MAAERGMPSPNWTRCYHMTTLHQQEQEAILELGMGREQEQGELTGSWNRF